ncbi:MAG: DinB family protein [Vicinamibacteria bacterium]
MHASIAPTVQLFGITSFLYDKALEGLDQKALLARPAEFTNPIVWIAGHLAYSRTALARTLGVSRDLPWPELFARGTAAVAPEAYPDIALIRAAWTLASANLMARYEELTEEELAAPAPRSLPIADKSIRGGISFAAFHESYHVGQMAYIRKWLGFPGLVDV